MGYSKESRINFIQAPKIPTKIAVIINATKRCIISFALLTRIRIGIINKLGITITTKNLFSFNSRSDANNNRQNIKVKFNKNKSFDLPDINFFMCICREYNFFLLCKQVLFIVFFVKKRKKSYSDQEKYYLEYLIRHEKEKKSKFSLLGIHHKHLDDYIRTGITKIAKGSKILDAGCGINAWPTKSMRKNFTIEGIDGEEDAVNFCKKHYSGKYVHGDLYKMPYKNSMFDAVTMREVIEHFKKPEVAVKEVYRILKPGGILVLTTPNYDSIKLNIIENTYNRFFGGHCKPYKADVHPSKFKFEMLEKLISKYFNILDHSTIDLGISQGIVAQKKK